jgi:hypothetical protein
MPSSKGWRKLKRAGGVPGAGTTTRHDGLGLLTYGGQTDDGEWLFILVDDEGRGGWALAETDGEAKRIVCDQLGLDKATVLGGRWARGGG